MAVGILKRVLFAALVFLGAGVMVSLLLSLTPDYAMNLSFSARAWQNCKTFLTFDYGYTQNENAPIGAILLDRGRKSLALIGGALVLVFSIGVPTGIFAALKRESRGLQLWSGIVYALSTAPLLVWASFLLLLAAQGFGLMPTYDELETHAGFGKRLVIYLLPIVALALGDGALADVVRVIREETAKVLEQDFIRALRARNVGLRRHLLRSLVLPIVSVFAGKISLLVAGTIVVEYIFNWRGLGFQIYAAVSATGAKDYPFILAATMLFAGLIIGLNFAGEIAAMAADPRLRK